ncbi:MAG: ParB/Srx family N-terminal domain-containing protein [Thiomicrospira sp.]|nr:ParB/Srx family N-terminal domain-containing protein [Thiomicrospira sp.]
MVKKEMQKLKIEYLETDELIPYEKNSRTHTESQILKIEKSIKEFGFINPVLVDSSNGIIAGHCRVEAAKKAGLVSVPCIRAEHLTDAQRRAYVIADNRLALDAGWDDAVLLDEIMSLSAVGFELGLTGFSDGELEKILEISGDFSGEPEGPAQPPENNYKEQYGVVVICDGERDQERVFSKLQKEGYKVKVVTT